VGHCAQRLAANGFFGRLSGNMDTPIKVGDVVRVASQQGRATKRTVTRIDPSADGGGNAECSWLNDKQKHELGVWPVAGLVFVRRTQQA